MNQYQRELFKSLINKLHLPASLGCFKNGMINELLVHTRSKRWSFNITLEKIMPFSTFIKFDKGIKKLFSDVSFLSLDFNVKNSELDDKLVIAYWPWVVKNCGLSKVMTSQLKEYGHLKVIDHKISFSTKNEALRGFLINGALVQIEDCYYHLGFPRFQIHVLGGKVNLPAKIIDFPIKKNNDDIKLARAAADALDSDSAN